MSVWRPIRNISQATQELRRHCDVSELQPYHQGNIRSCKCTTRVSDFASDLIICCFQLDYEDDPDSDEEEEEESTTSESDSDEDSEAFEDAMEHLTISA